MHYRKKIISVCAGLAAFLSVGPAHPVRASAPTWVVCCIDVIPVSPYEIDLSWTGPPNTSWGVTGYQLEREFPVGGGFTVIVANTGSTNTNYADRNLSPGVTYSYRISAVNSDGVGPGSSVLAAAGTPNAPAPIPPGRVQAVTATAVSGSEIDLSWTAPSSGSAITGYTIERESSSGGFSVIVSNTGSAATTYADKNLQSGETYSYRVSAMNVYGSSYYPSLPANATTPVKPGAPESATAAPGDGQATVSWLPPLAPGGDITGYTVSGAPAGSATAAGGSRSVVITGLTNGVSYSFNVFATNKAGQGPALATNSIVVGPNPASETASSSLPAAAPQQSTAQSPAAESSTSQSLQAQLDALQAAVRALMLQAGEKNIALRPAAQPGPPPGFSKNLGIGSTGDEVKALQSFLISQNKGPMAQALAAVGPSGYFGALTKNALAEYQKTAGISPAAGNFGPKTRMYINSLGGR